VLKEFFFFFFFLFSFLLLSHSHEGALGAVGKLNNNSDSEPNKPKSLVPVDQGEVVVGGVDLGVGLGLKNAGGGIASAVPGRVVRAAIAAAVVAPGEGGVLLNDGSGEEREGRIGVVLDDPDLEAGLGVGGHVNIEGGVHSDSLVLVGLGKGLAAKEANLLRGVPLELNRELGAEAAIHDGAEGLKDSHGARAVVIGSRGPVGRVGDVDAVLVGTNDDEGSGGVPSSQTGGDAPLVVAGVGNLGDDEVSAVGGDLLDAGEEPLGGLDAGGAPVVAGEEVLGEVGEVLPEAVVVNEVEDGVDSGLVGRASGEGHRDLGDSSLVELGELGNIHKAST